MRGKIAGFTLVELMVTIAVAAILLTVGVPSLKSLYDAYRGSSEISRIQQTLAFAKNQAVSYGAPVTVCPISSGTSCGNDWGAGMQVIITSNASGSPVVKKLKVVDGFNSNDSITGAEVEFRPDGLTNNQSQATFIYCPNGHTDDSRSVTVSVSGMIRYGDDNLSCGSLAD